MAWWGGDDQRVSVETLVHAVTNDPVWDSYEDLVAKLMVIKMSANMKGQKWLS